jgi:hypothetical protein
MSYANIGAPFNFLGNFTQSQYNAFSTWVTAQTKNQPQTQTYYQIRAQQLRKMAGMLETFYSTQNTEVLATNFQKPAWQPGPNGHQTYAVRDDQQPMVLVSQIKKYLKEPLHRQDEAIFHMNHVRRIIEKNEDNAQYANDAPTNIPTLLNSINQLFTEPQYQAALVRDTTDTYQGSPLFRTNQLDPPTPWEVDTIGRIPITATVT